jgi:polyhydroxyalkanoate synthesis regulator phasin
MQIKINETLRAYIEPLTENEYQALERSILTEGCRDALVLWEDVLVDGHNRYQICQEHGIPFKAIENTSFRSLEDVKLWMIDNNLGRRSISDYQRGVLALRKKEIMTARALEMAAEAAAEDARIAPEEGEGAPKKPAAMPLASREDIARAARLSSATIGQIEKIQKTATPELVEAVRAGTISINAAATVASLPEEVQLAAVAGGKKELQKAAKEVRDLRAAARPAKEPKEGKAAPAIDYSDIPTDVQELRTENAMLRQKNAALLEEITVLQRRISELANA